MTSIFEVNPLKEGPFPTKRRVIWASTFAGGAAPRSHGKHCSGTSGNGGSGGGPGEHYGEFLGCSNGKSPSNTSNMYVLQKNNKKTHVL